MTLTDLLEKNAKEFGDKIAFIMKIGYRTEKFTYSEVYNLSREVALFLRSLGVGKGDKVLVLAPNSPYWGILFWGAMLNGSILVPVNTQSTPEMIDKIIKNTQAKIVFKSRFLNQVLPNNVSSYDIEFLKEYLTPFSHASFEKIELNKNGIVEILYTSGTTGDPKGVILTHENILSNVFAVSEAIPLEKTKERILSILPLTHVFEQTIGFFLPQFFVSTIIFTHSYSAILDLMQKYKITKFLVVPEILKLLMSKVEDEYSKKISLNLFRKLKTISLKFNNKYLSRLIFYSVHKKFGGCLKYIASGGAFLDPELEISWNALGFTILQGYGLTETSPVISCNTYNERKLGSVGKLLKSVDLKLEKDGEILVKGQGVFPGYYNDKEKTDSVFTSDGFFKTGDIGEFDHENFLYLKGRKKYMIVGPGGQNIYPEDIELEINKVSEVLDSCVLGLPLKSGVVQIYAVVLVENKDLDISNIIDKANSKLASYQQVSGFSVWPETDFPRSATRKVKRDQVLKEVLSGQLNLDSHVSHLPLVELLSQITGIDSNKIENKTKVISGLQLDSLMRVELIMRIEDRFGISIDESILTSTITVEELQNKIDSKESPLHKVAKKVFWPRSLWAKSIRFCLQLFSLFIPRLLFRFKVEGLENLNKTTGPVIFMPNHISYIDALAVLMALPYKVRMRLAFAAAADVLYKEYKAVAWLSDLYFNSFSFPRDNGSGIKKGLDATGELIDNGYSVVVFPEGQMSENGKMLPLKKGAGLMAVEMNVPIVPIKIIGTSDVSPYGKLFPRSFSKISVKIGEPISFKKNISYDNATKMIEKYMIQL